MNRLNEEMLEEFRAAYENDPQAKRAAAACARTEIKDLVFLPMEAAKLNGDFSIEVKTSGITAQERSGRCWMYAMLNILREQAAKKLGLEEFKLSGNYMSFYDKLEKSNNLLEMAIANADKPLTDRKMEYIFNGFWDGGYWDMAADLVRKYGIVPDWVMPETYQSSHTERFMKMLNSLLRKDIMELRAMIREGKDITERKKEMLAEIYKAECNVYGQPVRTFHLEYRDKDGEYHAEHDLTPQEFCRKYTDINFDDYITVTNEPTECKPFNRLFHFHYSGSMADRDVTFLNLEMPELKRMAVEQLKKGEPVWFGCDSGAYGDRQEGVWDPASFDYRNVLGGADFFQNKKERLESHDSFATHAMILTGVNFDKDGKPDRWKIENSWGKDVGKNGYFVCSDRYFDEFVYEVIVRKELLSDEQKEMLSQEPVALEPWMM
ncbi:MAG: C1 family peptidase [Erysipelotrichaceae bacterium]|nr:C1 family peptidase [Erysipelotrichaceae bacterium]